MATLFDNNPIDRFNAALKKAKLTLLGSELAHAMTLSTVGPDHKPSARVMLLKGADERGFVFYTNLQSRKGSGLKKNGFAALTFWWPILGEQIRVEGTLEPVTDEEADEYFASRPRGSQIGAWASRQSADLSSREELLSEVEKFEKKFQGQAVPRPPHWSGLRVIPDRIEFWFNKPDRLHERVVYERASSGWISKLLYP